MTRPNGRASKLRPYQERTIKAVRELVSQGESRILVCGPTGSGKGVMATELMVRAARADQRALFIAHRREIITDIAGRVRQLGTPAGTLIPGEPRRSAPVQLSSIQTMLGTELARAPNLIIWDEAPHYVADEWRRLYERYPDALHVGFTATPERADRRPLSDAFDQLVVAATYTEMLAGGYLVPCEVLRPDRPLGIDLAQSSDVAYVTYAAGRRAIVYERSVRDAKVAAKRFAERGVEARVVVDSTPLSERKESIERFRSGDLLVIINVFCLTEGLDVPECDTIVLARQCTAESMYVQICGRALRPHPRKTRALLLDLCGSSYQHGMPTDDRHYTLDGKSPVVEKFGGEGGGAVERRAPNVLNEPLVGANISEDPSLLPKQDFWHRLLSDVKRGKRTMRSARGAYRYEYRDAPPSDDWRNR